MTVARVPDLDSLRLLTRIAGTGSLGRAAAEHGITQPAVSARLRSVEKLVGVPVVARGRQGSTLTPDGALLVDWAQDLLAAAEALGAGIEALRAQEPDAGATVGGAGTPTVAVSATTTVAEHLLPRWLARLAAESPATVALAAAAPGRVTGAVLGGGADLGFVEGPVRLDGLDGVVVARDQLLVVVPPGHPWAGRAVPVGPQELAAARFVEREPAAGVRSSFRAALAAVRPDLVPGEPQAEVTTASAVLAAVREGAGPGVVSSLAALDDVAAGRLVRVEVAGVDLSRRLRAVWRRGVRPEGGPRDLLRIAVRSDVWTPPEPSTDVAAGTVEAQL